ncbi:MAG: OmpH family outer membrane protein [Coraliomargarita sp.]
MKKISLALLASIFAVTALVAQTNVGSVDMPKLLNGYEAYQSAKEKYQGAIAPAEEELKNAQAALKEMQEKGQELEAKVANPALSEDAIATAKEELAKLTAEFRARGAQFQQFQQQAQVLRNQSRQKILLPLELKARQACMTVAKDKGIDLLLESSEVTVKESEESSFTVFRGTVIYASESVDVTDAVIALLNAEAAE